MTPYTAKPMTKKRIMTQKKTTRMLKTFRRQTATIVMTMKMTIRVTMMMEKRKIGIRDENHARKVKMNIVMMMTMTLKEPTVIMKMMITIKIPVTQERKIPPQWST